MATNKADKRRNGFNTSMVDRARINDEVRELLEDWPEGIRPTLPKLEDALYLGREFLRQIITDENKALMLDIADREAGRRGSYRKSAEYLCEFPEGEKRPYGNTVPGRAEMDALAREAIRIAGQYRTVSVEILSRMAACNRDLVRAATAPETRAMIDRHNRNVNEYLKRHRVGTLLFFDDDSNQIENQEDMKKDTNYGWIAAKITANSNALLMELLSFYAELPTELHQQEEGTAFDAMLFALARNGGRYQRKTAIVVLDVDGDGRWTVDSVGHNEIAATADLLRAELVYLLRSGDELVHVVRKANMIVPEVGSERTDVTPE